MSYSLEVDMIARACAKGLFTTPYVFSAADATSMTEAGADVVVCHLGLTTGGSIGAGVSRSLTDCVPLVDEWAAAARAVREDVIVLVHGGPVAEPDDARYILERCDVQGFYGASSMERLPSERAVTSQVRSFTDIPLP